MPDTALTLSILPQRLAICRLPPDAALPMWATCSGFCSTTRTNDELSIVCDAENVPPSGVACSAGWRALKVLGLFDFAEVGVLASVAAPLAAAGVGILAIATYNRDYVLVKEEQLGRAVEALEQRGHTVRKPPPE